MGEHTVTCTMLHLLANSPFSLCAMLFSTFTLKRMLVCAAKWLKSRPL